MDAYEAIIGRRSIRKYTEQKISEELIKELLTAAMSGPSAVNERPWQFIVVTESAQLSALAGAIKTGRYLQQTPLAIAVCGDLTLEKEKGYWIQDCSIAAQNLLLAAHAKGLGCTWVGGGVPHEDRVAAVRQILGLPEHVIPLNVIAIGYPAEAKDTPDRYDGTRVHYNRW